MAVLVRHALDVREFERVVSDDGAGAVLTFTGTTRNTHGGKKVEYLEYEAHETLATVMIEKLGAEAREKFGLIRVVIQHRLGRVDIGEASVAIAVSSAHRGAAYEGSRWLIDQLKTTIPIFKKEYYTDSSPPVWVGPDGKAVEG